MPDLSAQEFAQAHLDELARVTHQERLALRARSLNQSARVEDQSAGDAVQHPSSTTASTVDSCSTMIDPDPVAVRRPIHGRRGRSLVSWRMR
jgi:hypothetical protein